MSQQSFIQQLREREKKTREEASGLSAFESLRVKNASEFQPLGPDLYRSYKEELPLLQDLPKAPALGSFNFLLPKQASGLKDLYEDNWNSSLLTYAAVSDLYLRILQLVEEKKITSDSEVVQSATRALLCASNQPARNLQQYRYQATRRVNKHALKPGTERDTVINEEDAKSLQTAVDTASKLEKLTRKSSRPKAFGSRIQYYGREHRYSDYTQYNRGNYRGRRGGRGRGRGGRTGGRR